VKGETPREALLDRKSELVDAYMAVQTNLGLTTEHGIPRSLAITSTRPSEGKTTTALALAATLARGGRKVMLIDGDMRAPSIHKLGGVGHEKGLSNFLAGEDDISSLVFKMSEFGFEAISAGPIPPNAAELLTSARLNLLISELLKSYDHVIIDAPPVMGLADAPLIASRVEGVIFAVESHSVAVTMVKNALRRLASANTHVIGCVMTKFEASKARYDYEYGYTYGREIGTGVSAA
jgi:capsular exopolysaccharide synthesis family protein